MNNELSFRCSCPITSALDLIGDKWSLVIIKQILFEEKSTFKDFTTSDEAIATNILSSRLSQLEKYQMIEKTKLPTNKKVNIYTLTEKSLALTPLLVELGLWGREHIAELNSAEALETNLTKLATDKATAISLIIQQYNKHKAALFSTT